MPRTAPACRSTLPALLALLLAASCWVTGLSAAWALPVAGATGVPMVAPTGLTLGPEDQDVPVWHALRLRTGLPEDMTLDQARTETASWQPTQGPRGNLGPQRQPVGLALDLQVAAGGGGAWMLVIDYPSLDDVQLELRGGGSPTQRWTVGDMHPHSQRAVASRALAVPLNLQDGQRYQLVALVRSSGSTILPITLTRPEAFRLEESRQLLLQGLLGGAMACLLVYALAQGRAMREPAFAWFALNVLGTGIFFFSYNGLGSQHLWGDNAWASEKLTMLSGLLGLGSAFLYVEAILKMRQLAPRLSLAMRGLAGVLFTTLLLFALDLIGYRSAHLANVVLSPAPLVLALPLAWRLARDGDRVARYLLVGWALFGACAMCFTLLQRGLLPYNFWVGHAFQFGNLAELISWMATLALRTQAARLAGELAVRERDLLSTLAHTDALTGLLNRRGLQASVAARLAACDSGRLQAVYLIDLDRFKPINDTHGHDAGDAVLRGLADRLRSSLRATDLVARLGGDEFVVVAGPLASDAEAQTVGRKLQDCVAQPFDLNGVALDLGMTVGYALAPQDGRDLNDLCKRADAAMYAGKVAGRGGLRRGTASPGLAHGDSEAAWPAAAEAIAAQPRRSAS